MDDVMVLGGGMVGVATALALQARGRAVTLIDRTVPGREASYGNAGIIQAEAVQPYAFPRELREILAIALQRNNAVHYHLNALAPLLGPLWRYFQNSAPARHTALSAHYSRLILSATADHRVWIEAADAQALVRPTGYLQLYRSAERFELAGRQASQLQRDYGVSCSMLDSPAVAAAEPVLRRAFAGAVHWRDSQCCSDPGALVEAYAQLFRRRGGNVQVGDANTLARSGAGWSVLTRDGPLQAAAVVVALGAWSPQLLRRFGLRVPMVRKRGYHQHHRCAQAPLRPLYDVERAVLYCPMKQGVRVTSGAELALMGAPKTPRQLERGVRAAREVLPLGDAIEGEPWAGWRPCMPDMLPVIGAVPWQPGLWVNFGHGHQGFTLGPTSGRLLADAMGDAAAAGALEAFAATRFHTGPV